MNLIFGETIFDEVEIQRMIAKFSNKWVVHLKAIGLLENKEKENEVWEWYSDKTNIDVLNALINSNPESREVYVLLDNLNDVTLAYDTWFPSEEELLENERHLYVKFCAVSPDYSYCFTNERPEERDN